MITTVGEAQIVVRANTSAVKADIAATDVDESGALATKAGVAGEDAGAALSSGFGQGAKDIGKDATKAAEAETGKIKGLWNDVGKKASSSLSSFGVPASLLSTNKIAALGIAAIGVAAVKLGADMQKANAAVAANEGISVKAATNVGNAFLDTGGKVEFSGIKQAQAFAQVAGELKATQGQALTTAQSMTFMSSATDLATASGQDLTSTTTTLAGVMQAFQLPVTQAKDAAQTLFNASRDTGVGLDTLASSVERVKGRLGNLSPPLKDLSALMVDLTHNGITGRGALTALQGSYTALAGAATGTSKTNETAKETLKEYGIQVVNARGQLTPMSTIIEKLAPKFKTMTQQQQLQTATLIFGASAAKQMTAVIDAGTASYTKATTAVNQNNTVTKAAAINQDTLSGKIKVLGAAVSDDGTKLGSVLVPALTKVAGAILPVINALVSVVGWFAKGSAAAHGIEIVLASVLAPALIKMGVEATASAAKSVIAFVTMSGSATKTAATVATDTAGIDASLTGVGVSANTMATEVEGADARAALANAGLETSFKTLALTAGATLTGIIAKYGAAGIVIGGLLTAKRDIQNPSSITSKFSLLNALSGTGGETDMAGNPINLTKKQFADLQGAGLSNKNWDKLAAQLTKLNENPKKNADAIAAVLDKIGVRTGGLRAITDQAGLKGGAAGKPKSYFGKDAYIPPVNIAKKAASAGDSAAKKSAADAVKAQTTLSNEVLAAVKMPLAQGAASLKALGVPANKATAVLHDAVKPFTDAVKSLKAAGFTAAEAVRIADAGQAELTKEAKANAAKTKAATAAALKSGADSLTALTVNGIAVSGSIYRAAIGAAYKTQTGANLNGTTGVTPITSAPVAPTPTQSLSRGVVLNIQSGAVQIHPAAGNTTESLAATKSYVDQAFRQLAVELRSGTSGLAVVR